MSSTLNGILGRISYLTRRLKEGGVAFVALKIREKAVQALYWPVCKLQQLELLPRPESEVSEEFIRLGDDLAEAIASHHAVTPVHRDAQRKRLLKIKDGLFPVLGFGDLEIPSGQAWLTDQISGVSWPFRYFPFVPLVYSDDRSDIKVVWELSRLQYLMWIAESAVVNEGAERDSLITRFEQIVMDWDENNPCGYGPNWKCSMEVSIRAINLALSSAVIWKHLEGPIRERIVFVLAEHRRHLRKFPERSDISGNHLLFDLVGEVVLNTVVFESERSRARINRELESELNSQFYEDGVHFENAVAYHRFVVEGLSLAFGVLLRAGKLNEVPSLVSVLERGMSALCDMASIGGRTPVIGDCDSGQVISVEKADQSIAYLFHLVQAGGEVAPLFRVIADEHDDRLDAIFARPVDAYVFRAIGPYIKARIGKIDLLMRSGPNGMAGRASHDHDDNCSPWISFNGIDAIVERGCSGYTKDRLARADDIDSSAHNVVVLNSTSRVSPTPGSVALNAPGAPVPTEVGIHHDPHHGDAKLQADIEWIGKNEEHVRHSRVISIAPVSSSSERNSISVEDRISLSHGTARFALYWHIGPDWRRLNMERIGATVRFESEEYLLSIEVRCETELANLEVQESGYFPEYGSNSRMTSVLARSRVSHEMLFTTTIRFSPH